MLAVTPYPIMLLSLVVVQIDIAVPVVGIWLGLHLLPYMLH